MPNESPMGQGRRLSVELTKTITSSSAKSTDTIGKPIRAVLFRTPSFKHTIPSFETNHEKTDITSISPVTQNNIRQRYFRSRLIIKGETDRPELREYDPKEKWVTIIPIIGFVLGLFMIGGLSFLGYHVVPRHKYCSVLYDDFSHGFNPRVWQQEVQVGGFGNYEFEQTTGDNSNVFVQDGKLIFQPTLRNEEELLGKDSIVNLTSDGTCTSDVAVDCQFSSNISANYILPPVYSARINTKNSVAIRYGRVEVTAKLASGDWLLPSIWMLPVNLTYGGWPRSGEIDIASSRGNNYTYISGGSNMMSSTLHWGPTAQMDGWWSTNINKTAFHKSFASDFHTFGLEWSEKYLFTWIDTQIAQVLYTPFDQPQYTRGHFPKVDADGHAVANPWGEDAPHSRPFDQYFYLIISLSVGGTSGLFMDSESGKPWLDSESATASYDFWKAKDQWYPSWQESGDGKMEVSKVRMWQQCDEVFEE
ncbi:beta-1,3-glucan-binding protein [Phlyctema vagabunda]|uniref:Beta-1,3-glucan-binding protein n=1 Tax=Phlyctema vagabunda TaxID=108571 RepID=A0ABR4PT05_9HELO